MAADFMRAEEVVRIAKPADLIEIDCKTIYQHWVIYVGNGYIVNFGSDCDVLFNTLVKRQKLTEVAGSRLCRVNNRLDHTHHPHDPELVVRNALLMVGWEVPYSLETWCCENFVTALRYYRPDYGDVEGITITTLAVGPVLLLGSTLVDSLSNQSR